MEIKPCSCGHKECEELYAKRNIETNNWLENAECEFHLFDARCQNQARVIILINKQSWVLCLSCLPIVVINTIKKETPKTLISPNFGEHPKGS